MSKRGNNEGSIRPRKDKGLYEARYTGLDGKQHSLYAKTRQEVARKLTEVLRNQARGLPVSSERLTLGAYLERWLEAHRLEIRTTTWYSYEIRVRRHLIPALGRIQLHELSPYDLNRFYTQKLKEGLSPNTVRGIRSTLRTALRDALRTDLVSRNVTDLDKPPQEVPYVPETFTVEQARAFLDAIREDRFYALYILAMMTGMREGELLALTWDMIDLDAGTLTIRASQARINARFVISQPKTGAGKRPLLLNDVPLIALRQHRERQQAEAAALGDAWQDNHLVFPNEVGRRMVAATFYNRRYKPILRRAGLPDIRFHDLRHTMATFMLLLGIDVKIVSKMLGHVNTSITQNIYQHVMPAMEQEASDALQRLLFPDTPATG